MTDEGSSDGTAPQPEPLAVRPEVAAKMIGLSRSMLYALIEAGEVESIKIGRARLIPIESLRAFLAAQPRA